MESHEKKESVDTQSSCVSLTDMRNETIVVTHVENPEKFYCRLVSDSDKFQLLNELIWTRVRSPFTKTPDYHSIKKQDQLLAYSSIHKQWCRSEVYNIDQNNAMNAKLYLIDFGSIEVIALDQLRETDKEIVDFNCGQSFCFECSLCYIKPYNKTNEWSSYANYLFEKLTKDKFITLKYHDFCDGVIVCDLCSHDTVGSALNESFLSLIDYLVHTRVARYKMGQHFYHRLFKEDGEQLQDSQVRREDSNRFDDNIDRFEAHVIEYNTQNRLYF